MQAPRRALAIVISSLAMTAGHAFALTPAVRKVLIVGVDGMRPDAMTTANTPTFDALIAHGAVSYVCSAEDITISGPGWSSILTGVHRNKHLVVDNTFQPQNYVDYPHFFTRLQSVCDAYTASICDWAPINTQIVTTNADFIRSGLNDQAVADTAANLVATANPDIIFLHFDDVDHAGHSYGFSPTVPQYITAIENTDTRAGQVIAAIQARPSYANEDWLIIVTTDHGGTPDGSHGRNIPEHRLTPLIISGPSTLQGSTITPAPQMVDVPATIMTFLGLPIDSAWRWDGVPQGLDMAHATSAPFHCAPPPPPPLGACCLGDGRCTQLTLPQCIEQRGTWNGLDSLCAPGACSITTPVFAENFNALPLGANVNETTAGTNVWTATPPAGWSVDRSHMPTTGGVTEWRGWNFSSAAWWSQVAADQGRSQFTKGTGTIAVADPDEWDDLAHPAGLFNSTLSTRPISLAGVQPQTARLFLDSSWRAEGNQSASLTVSYDGGTPVTLADWRSQPGPLFKSDATNETLSLDLQAPANAHSMVLNFKLFDAGNNWWWAVDNLEIRALPTIPRRLLLSENFESVPLGPNVDETVAADHVWSGTPPQSWTFDDASVPGINDPTRGVTEWKGWAITNRQWWVNIAADQRRSEFTRGLGAVAVADPDEWDDRGTPTALGFFKARMLSPTLSLQGIAPNSLELGFDSSWRPEATQHANLYAVFNGGASTAVLDWSSQAGPTFHPDATNEHLTLPIPNPPEATTVQLQFVLSDAKNNWWWAIDNVVMTGAELQSSSCAADFNNDGGVDGADIAAFFAAWERGDAAADVNNDGGIDGSDVEGFFTVWEAGGC